MIYGIARAPKVFCGALVRSLCVPRPMTMLYGLRPGKGGRGEDKGSVAIESLQEGKLGTIGEDFVNGTCIAIVV